MYPYELFLGLDLYSLLIVVGVVLCMIFIRLQADWLGLRAKFQNILLINTVAAVVLGYGFAVLFQAFYNYMADGVFTIANDTGSTFYGGLIGGTATFIAVYFIEGKLLFPDGYHLKHFRTISDMAPACITVAHGFGRLGCLMAGCCYGARTDAWYGIPMDLSGDGTHELVRVIPVQLYEAVFLLALSAVMLLLFKKGKKYQMPIYMMAYALWRFVAEYLRADDRGATVVEGLSPSQLISVLLLAGGLLLLGIELFVDGKKPRSLPAEGNSVEVEAPAEGNPVEGDAPAEADSAEADSPEADSTETPAAPIPEEGEASHDREREPDSDLP